MRGSEYVALNCRLIVAADRMLANNILTGKEYKSIHKLLRSPDRENWIVAEQILVQKNLLIIK